MKEERGRYSESLRARVLIDSALYLQSHRGEGEVPIHAKTMRLTADETPLTRAGLTVLPKPFVGMYGEIGDPNMESQVKDILGIGSGWTYGEMSRYGSDFRVEHSILPSQKYEGLYIGQQKAVDYAMGIQATRSSILVTPRDLRKPAQYNIFLARLVTSNGHQR